jgi:hypothetical protein
MHAGLLEGATLEELLSKATEAPRLFFVDYMEPHRSYAERIDARGGERKQHAGRLLLYKRCRSKLRCSFELRSHHRSVGRSRSRTC